MSVVDFTTDLSPPQVFYWLGRQGPAWLGAGTARLGEAWYCMAGEPGYGLRGAARVAG